MVLDCRVFDRFKASYPARFKDSSSDDNTDVYLEDVSAEGMRLSSTKRINLSDKISVVVDLPDGHDPIILDGEVVWTQDREPQRCDVGVKFDKVNLMKTQRIYSLSQISGVI